MSDERLTLLNIRNDQADSTAIAKDQPLWTGQYYNEGVDNDYFDKLKEECGVFGIFGHPEASALSFFGLHALQHRGEESAGICSSDGTNFYFHRDMGLV
jgi:amidophosphoribosyltransferase